MQRNMTVNFNKIMPASRFLEIFYDAFFNRDYINQITVDGGTVQYQLEKKGIVLLGIRYDNVFEIFEPDSEQAFFFDVDKKKNPSNRENYENFVKFYRANKLQMN